VDRLGQLGEQLVRRAERALLVVEMGEQDGELVAAEARGGVGRAQTGADPACEAAQEPVSDRLAERVVDRLEAVEVDRQHGETLVRRGARRTSPGRAGRGNARGSRAR
jgi:hypothetical protein